MQHSIQVTLKIISNALSVCFSDLLLLFRSERAISSLLLYRHNLRWEVLHPFSQFPLLASCAC